MSVSRSLTKAEKKNVALELECLAIIFACQKFHHYIYGKHTLVETDHKPLEVITKKSISAAPRRLQRMLLQLQRYDLEIINQPGKQQWIAHILSRLPVESPCMDKFCRQEIFQTNHGELEVQEFSAVDETDYVHVKNERIEEVRQAAKEDKEQELLRQVIVDGWPPSIRDIPVGVRCYWNYRDTLTVSDGVIYKGDQIVVPTNLRKKTTCEPHGKGVYSKKSKRCSVLAQHGKRLSNL